MAGLCIVSRDYPMLFGYLVLLYGRQAQAVDVIMDRRHAGAGAGGREAGSSRLDRRVHPEIEEALRVRGYALVTPGRKGGRRQVELAEPPGAAALTGDGPSDFIDDDEDGRPVRTPRAIIAAATVGAIVLGLFIIMAASEDLVGSAAQAAVAVIEWVRGDAATRTTTASRTTTTPKAAPADFATRPPAAPETSIAPLTGAATRSPEPAVAVPSPTLPPPTAARPSTPPPAASAPSPTVATPAPRVNASPTVTSPPAPRPAARPAEEPSRDAAGAERSSAPSWSGLPKVELSSQPSGSGAKRTLAYTVKLSDTEGRPLSGADVWLRVAMPDRPEQETKLLPAESPGIYRGRLTVGTRTPEVSRVRVGIGGTRVEVPVQPR